MDAYIPLLVILVILSYAAYLSILLNDKDDNKK